MTRWQATQTGLMVAALLAAVGCGEDTSAPPPNGKVVDEILPASVEAVSLPALCRWEEGVEVRLEGTAGPSSCYSLDCVLVERGGRTYSLRPLARLLEQRGEVCEPGSVCFDTTVVLHPPENGPWWVVVIALNDTLVDSTKVES